MATPAVQYTPVQATRGKKVHAITLSDPGKAACGRKISGGIVSLKRVNCHQCKLAIVTDCRPPKAPKKAKRK